MAQGEMPEIFGLDWSPSGPLKFVQPLHSDAARQEFLMFIAQRHESRIALVCDIWDHVIESEPKQFEGPSWNKFSSRLTESLERAVIAQIEEKMENEKDMEVIPRRNLSQYIQRRASHFIVDVKLMLRRLAHYMSVTIEQRLEWQRLMTRTRYLDEALKEIYSEGIETPDGSKFGGKGFRSTWQEGVVAVATALNRNPNTEPSATPANGYDGDLVAPMIRDVGLALAMGDTPIGVMSANLGKVGSNQNGGWDDAGGRDLHIGAWNVGVLPPTAPLPIASVTMTGLAFAAWRKNLGRFHVACIGEGASSSGEFWEAMNFAGTRGLPITYILQNNQIALDTSPKNQSGVEVWADKAVAMGFPSWTIDGSDPAAWHASVACAREFSLEGGGPTLIHVETMRGCGHAHHHDDLYLGSQSGTPPGYVDKDLLSYWEAKDPLPTHRELLINLGVDEQVISDLELQEKSLIVVSARLKLEAGHGKSKIRKITNENFNHRLRTQPYKEQSCGSVFRNPEPLKAAKLIEEIGLKGFRFGGAEISKIHSNFIINTNKASSDDVQGLIKYIQKKVLDAYGILLETEVKQCGF